MGVGGGSASLFMPNERADGRLICSGLESCLLCLSVGISVDFRGGSLGGSDGFGLTLVAPGASPLLTASLEALVP